MFLKPWLTVFQMFLTEMKEIFMGFLEKRPPPIKSAILIALDELFLVKIKHQYNTRK